MLWPEPKPYDQGMGEAFKDITRPQEPSSRRGCGCSFSNSITSLIFRATKRQTLDVDAMCPCSEAYL